MTASGRLRRLVATGVAASALVLVGPPVNGLVGGQATVHAATAFPKLGDRGAAVVALQQALIKAGVPLKGGADGLFGSATTAAIKTFQQAKRLAVTGAVDQATAIALGLQAPAPATPAATAQRGAATTAVSLPRVGTRGTAVVALQQALIRAGITVRGGADGVFGTATTAAIKSYQQAKGLPATGVLDVTTATKLGLVTAPVAATTITTTVTTAAPTTTAAPAAGLPRRGDRGTAVVALQQALIRAGVKVTGGADGLFGAATTAAIASFQKAKGLPVTGVVDAATAAALGLTGPTPTPPSTTTTTPPTTTTTTGTTASGFPVYGERGTRVAALQQALINMGVKVTGGADGVFGAATATAIRTFQRARGLPVTGVVDASTAAALGLTPSTTPTTPANVPVRLAVFPVQGLCSFVDTWQAPRGGGRLHEGVDIIAASGKLLYAVADGTITRVYTDAPGSLSGNGVRLTTADGTYYFYAHMTTLADGIALGSKVKAGQIVGYVGMTGNAAVPHLHFEVHPGGGAAVNPYPYVKAIDACKVTAPMPQPAA